MKNLMLLITLGFICLTSCSKEELNEPTVEQKTEAVYLFKLSSTNDWEASVSNKSNTAFSSRSQKNSLHAHGDFSGFGGGLISFSGTQNNGGAHGSATLDITFGPFGTANVVLETVSVVSIGNNEVVYGGQISEVIENTVMFPPPPPGFPAPQCDPYDLGTYVYFAVKDNGQGNNAPLDQYSPFLSNSCNEDTNGGANNPWSFFGFSNVESPKDKIKVNI
ncbi:hypothetical protein [Psychroserpens luteolus]|uniref:hypothetical protein n=1 Tax=Psychroserpens luteolus TaxID=2855840 RepID=UPI001E540FD0|nr:hypothetical protein [Psychroserpens luteolus]MCD2259138.1 hypothetical protein [Psychroserpens luteolus]